MTASGVYQVIERRGREAGVEVNPDKFRHTFSHVFLDRGGAEGDLMELNGWTSPQMLARYACGAGGARARRHYDDVMGPDAMTGTDKAISWSTALPSSAWPRSRQWCRMSTPMTWSTRTVRPGGRPISSR